MFTLLNMTCVSNCWTCCCLRLTDSSIVHITKNCRHIVDLNLSGCKNISDKGMRLIANSYPGLKKLNITRCVKLTDDGLKEVLQKCSSLESLNLYALSSFTDKVYKEIGLLSNLTFLDLCGAQVIIIIFKLNSQAIFLFIIY